MVGCINVGTFCYCSGAAGRPMTTKLSRQLSCSDGIVSPQKDRIDGVIAFPMTFAT